MKKIKYGSRKNEGQHKQLQNLREGDEICEAVLDTLSDDYLDYISHLVKSSKTPLKSNTLIEKQQHSSNSQDQQKLQGQQTITHQKNLNSKHEQRIRHHSESGGKSSSHHNFKDQIVKKIGKEFPEEIPRKLSYQKDKQSIMRQQSNQKKKKKKIQYSGLQADLKNQQKTMSFTRNYKQVGSAKHKQQAFFREVLNKKEAHPNKPKYYTNYHEYSESSNQKMSINQNIIINQRESQRQNVQHNFLNEIDNYISHLQSNPSSKMVESRIFSKKQQKEKYLKEFTAQERRKSRQYEEDFGDYNIQQILKENLKLNKKVKSYQQKIEELEDEVSSHLIQCRNRQKNSKNKIEDLWKALTQAVSKIQNQKSQIASMKGLLKSFGQKVRQMQNENEESDDAVDDISESIIKYIAPQRNSSELRTKYKRGLQSTMPKHEQDRRIWRE